MALFFSCLFFQNFWNGYILRLKAEGKADTQHTEAIPQESQDSIMDLIVLLQAIMGCKDKDTEEYRNLVSKLPEQYQDCYHFLMQYALYYIFAFLYARRGAQGIDLLSKSHFEKLWDEDNKIYYWLKVKGELSKNNRYVNILFQPFYWTYSYCFLCRLIFTIFI